MMNATAWQSLQPLLPFLVGPVVTLITEFIKRTPSIPINSGSTAVVRATVIVLSVLGSLLIAHGTGTWATVNWTDVLNNLYNAGIIYVTAIAAYEHSGVGEASAVAAATGVPK